MATAVTELARVELSSGAVNALRAERFSRPFPPHFHDTFAIGVVESGATVIRTRRGEWMARPGSILAFAPHETHSAIAADANGYSFRMVYPSAELMQSLGLGDAGDGGGHRFHAPVIEDRELSATFLHAHAPLMEGAGSAPEGRLMSMLEMLLRRHAITARGNSERPADLAAVGRAMQYLEERYRQPVRLNAVATECGVSPFHLIRLFRRAVGLTPYAYLVQLRVNHAQEMLARGQCIADVAYHCGFSDQSHLTRIFKRAVGVPPGQFVRQVCATAA